MRELTKVTKHNVVSFDWEIIKDLALRNEVKEHSAEIHQILAATGRHAVEIGRRLNAVKAQLPRGQFVAWIKGEFEWGLTHAYRFIRVSDQFGDLDCLDNFVPTALYMLVNTTVDSRAASEAVQTAQSGQRVTTRHISELIAKYKPSPTQSASSAPRHTPSISGHAPSNGHSPKNAEPVDRYVYSVRVSLGRELDQRETRLLRPLIENLLSEEFNDVECQVEAIDAEAEAVA